jgi:hypothetical protein
MKIKISTGKKNLKDKARRLSFTQKNTGKKVARIWCFFVNILLPCFQGFCEVGEAHQDSSKPTRGDSS